MFVLRTDPPFPSVADGLYLGSYALVPPALLVAFGAASGQRRVRAVLDAGLVALALGAVGWQLLIAPQMAFGMSWATATGIAYPLLGVIILVTLLSVGFAGHRHVPPSVRLIGAAFAVSAVTDAGYTWLTVLHEYVTGDWVNLGWQVEAVLLCLAAGVALRHAEGEGQVARFGRDLPWSRCWSRSLPGWLCSPPRRSARAWVRRCCCSLRSSWRGWRALRALGRGHPAGGPPVDAALREQERLAVSDELTGLYNRRFVEEVQRLEVDRAGRDGGQVGLLVADLDHFKAVNDTHGHQSGDAVLAEAAARLRRRCATATCSPATAGRSS